MFYKTIEKVDSIIEKCFKIIIISLDKGISVMDINDIYKIASNEKTVRTVRYGRWVSRQGITELKWNIWERRSDFKDHNFR